VVTQADIDAQKVIMKSLRSAWGNELRIIGEEDDCDVPTKEEDDVQDIDSISKDIFTTILENHSDLEDTEIALEELTLFVDPLDGTREFVENRLENVGCLIGIAQNGKAIGGAVGVPFPSGKVEGDDEPMIHYSFLQNDQDPVYGTYTTSSLSSNDGNKDVAFDGITVFTGDSKNPVLQNATNVALSFASSTKLSPSSTLSSTKDTTPSATPTSHTLIGGTAAKLNKVSSTPNSIAVLHFVTSLWDTCATEAFLHAKGGKVTDLFGAPLTHSHDYQPKTNVFGVVASSGEECMNQLHDALCRDMRKDYVSVQQIYGSWMGTYSLSTNEHATPQAIDIARDLDGAPLQVSWLQSQIDPTSTLFPSWNLQGYAVPESYAARGLMSNGCRICLHWEWIGTDAPSPTHIAPPSSLFYKRVVMSESPDSKFKLRNVPHKLLRDVKSYQVETAFLTSHACQTGLIQEANVPVNKVYASDLRPQTGAPKEQIQSKFAMLVQDLSEDWKQEWLLEQDSAKAALEAFSRMHGYFWKGSRFWTKEEGVWGNELTEAVWTNGGYMQPKLQGWDQLTKVDSGWRNRLPSFEKELHQIPELENVDLSQLGMRLQKVAKIVGMQSHPFMEDISSTVPDLHKYRTLIHGDPKQANIFLRTNDETSKLEAGLIDFQWTGFGLAATDVAHFICAAVQPTCLSYDGTKETELLDCYYSSLTKSLVQNGVATSEQEVQETIYPRALFQEHYEIAVLDICRMVFGYAWKRWKPETEPTPASLNRNAYNKSLPNVLWLITRCSQVLNARETSLLSQTE